METQSLEQLVAKYSFQSDKDVISLDKMYKSPYLAVEYVNAVGNYFKKPGYTAVEYMMIICCADVAAKQRFTTRQYVDLLRFGLPMAATCKKAEVRCVVFAAGGDYHIVLIDNGCGFAFDGGLRIVGDYNLETMWNKLKEEL